jgi:hypothetical protein
MRSVILSIGLAGVACSQGSGLNIDVKEGEAPSSDTATLDTADPDDTDTDDTDDTDDPDDTDTDDPDDPDDTDTEQTEKWNFSGDFSVGPEGMDAFCSDNMTGVLSTDQIFASVGYCTIDRGPGEGEKISFSIKGEFQGEDFDGLTYFEGRQESMALETEGFYDKPSGTMAFEWVMDIPGPDNQEMQIVGFADLEKE